METREQYELRKIAEKRHAYMEEMQPFFAAKSNFLNHCFPQITIYPDGRTEYIFSDWQNARIAEFDALIKSVSDSLLHSLELPTSASPPTP